MTEGFVWVVFLYIHTTVGQNHIAISQKSYRNSTGIYYEELFVKCKKFNEAPQRITNDNNADLTREKMAMGVLLFTNLQDSHDGTYSLNSYLNTAKC